MAKEKTPPQGRKKAKTPLETPQSEPSSLPVELAAHSFDLWAGKEEKGGIIAGGFLPISPWVEKIYDAFSPAGLLSRSADFEYREEQQRMAVATAEALEKGESLLVEAGTGVGKSLAYLVPAILHALEQGKKAVISTHTINLQEQLVLKDIPLVRGLCGVDFNAALLKGRGNYLCTSRLSRAMATTGDLFSSSEEAELRRIYAWSRETKDGTLSELGFSPHPKVWAQVCSEPHVCTGRTCGPESGCFYQAAKRKVQEAKVVVLNHTLFFGLLSQGGLKGGASQEDEEAEEEGFIFPSDFVILDEAHTIENIAAQQLGLKISQFDFRHEIQRLYNGKTKKGLLVTGGNAHMVSEASNLYDAVETFFDHVRESVDFDKKGNIVRVREAGLVENIVSEALLSLSKMLLENAEDLEHDLAKAEYKEAARRLLEYHGGIKRFLEQEDKDYVYWVERSGAEGRNVSLHAAPVEVAELLGRLLFGNGGSAILTSATLSAGEGHLGYFQARVGAKKVRDLQIGSPFDFEKQMRVLVAQTIPEPTALEYKEKLKEWICYALEETEGRAFVLFTSYKLMQEMGVALEPYCRAQGWDFFIQGGGKSRHQMLLEFKASGKGVLLGADSFWTGVDVPGEALSQVIITRLPFDVPDHPLVESRLEAIALRGGNSFMEYSVPEAILKLRQGIGRLIRTQKDTGLITLLDSRVCSKFYGKRFLKALPPCPRQFL